MTFSLDEQATWSEFRDFCYGGASDTPKMVEIFRRNPSLGNKRDDDGRSPFHWACACNKEKFVDLFLSLNVKDVNSKDEEGWTALHSAASAGHAAIVTRLLSQGADLSAQTSTGGTALHYAASKGREAVVRLLCQAGACLDAKDGNGHTPLMKAVCSSHEAVVEFLLERGAGTEVVLSLRPVLRISVHCQFRERGTGDNVLHMAVNNRHVEISSFIYRANPTLSATRNLAGDTPADLATRSILLEWKGVREGSDKREQ